MISELFSSLAAPVFAAMLLLFFLKNRSREINGGEASSNVAGNDGTAGGASSTHSSTGVPERATSSGPATYAAANDGTAGGDSGASTSTGVPEMATSSGPAKGAAANDGTAGGASSTHSSTESQRMDTSSGYDYEVFLSFRGSETRSSFVDFLYTRLNGVGIHTFKDDESIRVGEEFEPKLLKAISQSKISIPIFTKGYASSVWCLKEVAHMVRSGHHIKPIFYDVAPAVVRYQTDDYAKAFLKHKEKNRHDEETMEEWKKALKKVADLSGWDLHNETNSTRREGEFAERVTREVFSELKKANLVVSDCLVRVDNHVNAIMKKIGAPTSETRIIGVHGMGGSGKTTIAKLVYNELSSDFQHCCFLSNIREMSERKGIEFLQDQLISDVLKEKLAPTKNIDDGIRTIKERLCTKKVLLLLDDVDDKKHMDALVGEHNWFGPGSKLIITTRNKRVLEVLVKDDDFYEVDGMNDVQSLELFSKHAFKSDSPFPEYIHQSNRATRIARRLPLALEVIGSLLGHTEKEMWDATLKMLESVPGDKVQSKLKISYDALDFRQKHIFLDIACLFIGHDKDILVHFWDKSIFFPEEAMRVLQSMSLIKINEDNAVWMHDQLRDLGREIVCEKSDTKIEKQSRVWDAKEGLNLLRRHKGKKEAEALRLKLEHQSSCRFTYEGFENLSDLRFLEVVGSRENFRAEERLLWRELPSNVLPTNENSDLLPYLRWLSWSDFPPTFNIANFFMEDVVILNLSESAISYDWKGWSYMKVMKNLKVLNLYYCRNLQRLPDELGRDLSSLEYLSLNSCVLLERLPDSIENLTSLIELDISWTRIEELPDSIGKLKNLKKLKMRDSDVRKIPDALWTIEKLEEIEATNRIYSKILHVNIGNCIYKNQSLRILRLYRAAIYALPKLPESLIKLELHELHLKKFPDLSNLANLKELVLQFSSKFDWESDGPLEEYLMGLPPQLKSLKLSCPYLRRLPRLSSSLSSLRLYECKSLCSMEDLSNLKNLSSLDISFAAIEEIQGLGCLENLRDLKLYRLEQVKILPNLSNLNKLRYLEVRHCCNLVEIQGELPRFLDKLGISSCDSLRNLPDLSSLMCKQEVDIRYCSKLNMEAILGFARMNPQYLQIGDLGQVEILPDLSNSSELRRLEVLSCRNLVEIQGKLPQSLEELRISFCESLQKLPDLSSLKELKKVDIRGCTKLKGEAILGSVRRSQANLWENLQSLRICDLGQVKKLPDLNNLNKLRHLEVEDCENLVEIQGELPESLEELEISSCKSLQKLPDLSSLNGLRMVTIKRCKKLNVEAISSLCLKKSVKFVGEDERDREDWRV